MVSPLPFPARFPFRAGKSIPIFRTPRTAEDSTQLWRSGWARRAFCVIYCMVAAASSERGPRAGGRTGRRDRHSKLVRQENPFLHFIWNSTCESFANPLKKPFEKPSKSFLFPSARGAPRCRCPSLAVGRPSVGTWGGNRTYQKFVKKLPNGKHLGVEGDGSETMHAPTIRNSAPSTEATSPQAQTRSRAQ